MMANGRWWLVAAMAAAVLAGCAAQAPAPDYQALVASPDRSDADRTNDVRRKPVPFLAFMDVRPGMQVADISAGGGYTTELLARAVGPTGRVYAHNTPKPRLEERMKKPVMKNVVEVVGPFDSPLPAEARNLDLVTFTQIFLNLRFGLVHARFVCDIGRNLNGWFVFIKQVNDSADRHEQN